MSEIYKDYELGVLSLLTLKWIGILKLNIFFPKKCIDELKYCHFIRAIDWRGKKIVVYKRLPAGTMYIRYHRKDGLRFLIPTTISILALLQAYDVYTCEPLAQILQALSSLMKNMLENLGGFF